MGTVPAEPPLVGREEELDVLRDATPGAPRNVVIGGAAGVGKSRLLAEHLRWHMDLPMTVVHVRATSSTASIPFGAFARWVPRSVSLGADQLEILRAIADSIASPEGVRVGVDDAHLLDEASAALCLELAQRPEARLTLTVRTGEPTPDAVTALWKDGLAERIDIQALSELQTRQLLASILGEDLAGGLCRRVWDLTEGVPLYIREVVAAGLERGVIRAHGDRWDWDGELPGSDRIRSVILGRVEHVSEAGRRALELLALGEPLALAVMTNLADPATMRALEASGHIVVDARPDGDSVRLSHPLYGEVIRSELPVVARRHACAELVDATRHAGLEAPDLLRLAAWHVDSDQDPDVALLLAAVERAFVVDDWALTDRLAASAEAAGAGDTATLMIALSSATLGRWPVAEEQLAKVDPRQLDDGLALRWATIRAWIDFFHLSDSAAAIATLDAMRARGGAAAAGAAAQSALLALFMADLPEVERQVRRVRAIDDADEGRLLLAAACEALRFTFLGDREAARAVVHATMARAIERLDLDATVPSVLAFANLYGLVLDGELDAAAAFAAGVHALTAGQLPSMRALSLTYVAYAELFRGDPARALTLAQEAHGGHGDRDLFARKLWSSGAVAWAAAQLGDVETAEAAIAWTRGRWPLVRTYHLQVDVAAAWLADARGQTSRAHGLIEAAIEEARSLGLVMVELFALHDLVRLGAPQRACARLTEIAAITGGPYAAAVADHAAAAMRRDGDALDDVAGRFEEMGARLCAAEACAQAAGAHRRSGRRGSELTSSAAARRLQLACSGARTAPLRALDDTPVFNDLTTREREVVDLAARQLTNREIATELFISVRTVTTHLQRAYAKLGVNDRAQLAVLVSRPDQDAR